MCVVVLCWIDHDILYGLPKSVCVVPVIPMSVYVLLPYVLFVFLYVGSYLLI